VIAENARVRGAAQALRHGDVANFGRLMVASYVGFHAEPTIEGTSVATTRAVVNASLLVLMFNFVLSAFLFQG
jgi:ABC-type transporter Mla maintaining outer membrane lipid asymmetry permease subunit MlaE